MQIDIIKVANGLETVRGQINTKLNGVNREECNAKRACLSAMAFGIKEQLRDIYNSAEYSSAWRQLDELNKPDSEFLQSTKGLNGSQVLMLTNKKSA